MAAVNEPQVQQQIPQVGVLPVRYSTNNTLGSIVAMGMENEEEAEEEGDRRPTAPMDGMVEIMTADGAPDRQTGGR